ncbi:MAG TPA: clostripain-related cysteine peptidase [Vicinamibacterales bacterium]|jgi:hypothetical protein|nr:clostripain-related cysteine peptidase [Vicinamibacterales bacterium]
MAQAATDKAKWTVMVYMAAGDGADLDANAVSDLQEMERANVGRDINVVVQINRYWPTKPQRYRIGDGQTTLVRADIMDGEPIADGTPTKMAQPQKDGANMGSRETLANFLQWSRHHYPADRYFLVLWGHAYGLGYGRDHGDPMTLPEIREAIHEFRQPLEAQAQAGASQEWPKLDLLGANACAMSYAEAACELRSEVQYLVASEIAIPLAGWPYETILGCMSKQAEADPAWDMPPDAVGQLVADRYVTQFDGSGTGERGAMSVLNLNAADTLTRHVADLGQAILNVVDGTDKGAGERLAQIRGAFIGTAAGDVRPLVDLVDLSERLDDVCVDLRELSPHPTLEVLSAAARRLASFLAPGKETTHDATQRPDAPRLVTFVAQHKDLEGLHGIGIFAPFVTDERDLKRLGLDAASPETGRPAYDRLELAKAAKAWAPLVFDRLRAGLPEPVLAAVEGSGAGNRADRSAVMQMLASLDSTLDALDRRIAATQSKALANVPAVATAVPAVLEQSALNMLGKMQLLRHEEIDKMLAASMTASPLTKGVGGSASASSTPVWSGSTLGTSDQVDQTAHAFFGLERLIGKTERTIRRTLTNGTFGLGPGLGAPRDKEGLLGAPRDKEGLLGPPRDKEGLLGAPRDKEGLLGSPRDKEGLLGRDKEGLLGVGSPVSTAGAAPGAVIAELFRQVSVAMQSLEAGGADVETIAAKALLAPGGTTAFELLSHVTLAKSRLERAFRALAEASTDLRRTVHRVASHPTYGVGPGSQGVTVDDRRELASASGLNSTELALL